MCDKIKKIIFGLTMSYMFIFSILILQTLLKCVDEFVVSSDDYYSSKLSELREKTNKLNNEECRDGINKMIDISEKTIFTGTVEIKKFYKTFINNGSPITGYLEAKKGCNLNDEASQELGSYIVNSTIVYDEIIQKYKFQYEIHLKDKEMRNLGEATVINSQLKTSKLQELAVIDKIIEVEEENEK